MQRVQPTWAWARRLSIPIGSPRASEEGAGTWTRCCFCFFLSAFLPSTLLPSARYAQTRLARIIVAALPSNRLTYLCLCLCASLSSPMQMVRRCIMAERLRECCPNSRVPASPAATCTCNLPCTTALLCSRPHPGTLHTWCKGRLTRPRQQKNNSQNHVGPLQKLSARLPHCLTVPICLVCCCHWRAPSILLSPVHGSPAAPASSLCSHLHTLAHTCTISCTVLYCTWFVCIKILYLRPQLAVIATPSQFCVKSLSSTLKTPVRAKPDVLPFLFRLS
jgi:hypothetical protein